MKWFRDSRTQTIALVILSMILLSSLGGTTYTLYSFQGYTSGFQGPKAEFKGVSYKGLKYTDAQRGEASQLSLQGSLLFDADQNDDGKPNIEGEMTTVFVPSESLRGTTSWVPIEWLTDNDLIENPQNTYSWNITTDANTTKVYKMEQWVMKWYVSFSAHWDGAKEQNLDALNLGQNYRNYYDNAEIWFEFDISPTWYIQGGGTAYFAVGKMQLAKSVLEESEDVNGKKYEADTMLSVIPESQGASLYVYTGLFGTGSAENTEKSFEGRLLNPQFFRDKVYAKITLANFGIRSWNEWGTVKTHGDVATFNFNFWVFVIGEWDVQDIQKIPEDFGRTIKLDEPYSFLDLLKDPRTQALLTMLAMAGFFLLILLVAPGFLIAVIAIFAGRKRK